ncbi:telomere-associated protein Tap [Streptomyces sp. BE303]|uniref:telomere-associated protein Tap n=1 Tax=Streptomyces sp. BE303 TaxID=3002528 RepID=UPI002E7A8804|nr:helix-turn-helix transcriptional regulator [Streptomyces sp. BE303]MED7952990.1 helix-turn-helix transcriptional regulator [Streptomyces sp. BE303]
MSDDLFAAIDALLERPRSADDLPVPAERERLRKAAQYTQEDLAKALKTRRETIVRWEAGATDPRPPKREVYIAFLATLALQHGTVEPTEWLHRAQAAGLVRAARKAAPLPDTAEAPASADTTRETPAPVAVAAPAAPVSKTATAPVSEPPAPTAQLVMLDQNPDGSLLMAAPAPCVQCGQPSVYRAQGRPMHLGGFCRPAAAAAAVQHAPPAPAAPAATAAAVQAPAAVVAPVAAPRQAAPAPAAAPAAGPARRTGSSRPAASSRARKAPAKTATAAAEGPSDWEAAAAARFPSGPLAVLDVAPSGKGLVAYLADGTQAPTAPAGRTLAAVVEWALEQRFGSPRLHRHGKDGDALVVLTDAALAELGLPPLGRDEKTEYVQRLGQLPKTHKAVKAVEKAGWLLTQRGLGPWARIYRTPEDGRRQCVQLCIPGWGALASGGWTILDNLTAPDLARLLGTYAKRVLTPRGSTAVSGLELVTALRPPTRAVRTESGWTSGPVEGSRPKDAFDPAPSEVPEMHPLAQDRETGAALVTEAWDWHRELTDTEKAAPFAVGLDVNMAFLAAAGRLVLPLSGPVHELNPVFDPKTPGSWLVDLSGVDTNPLLPSPFTADGSRPTGPAWYSTAKVAYAVELGAAVQPTEGWLRHESGPYLDPWHKHLRQAYVATMAALGVPLTLADSDPVAFLDAMAAIKTGDPAEVAVLTAIKQTAKGTIGKMRERPRGHGYRPGQRWPALERPTWDPLMRALVIDTATVNFHRKLRKMAAQTGLHCFAVLSDCAVFAAPGPGALDILTCPDHTLTTALRLGVSPGMVKFEGSRPMAEIVELIADGANPARHIKTGGAVSADE